MSFTRACALDEIENEKPFAVTLGDVDVALVRDGDRVYAVHDECSHASIPLSEGDVESKDGTCLIECWLHGSTFDLSTGQPTTLPAFEPVPIYPVRIEDSDVLVDVDNPINEGNT